MDEDEDRWGNAVAPFRPRSNSNCRGICFGRTLTDASHARGSGDTEVAQALKMDQHQTLLAHSLNTLVRGHREIPLVFFRERVGCRESDNAALRARAAG